MRVLVVPQRGLDDDVGAETVPSSGSVTATFHERLSPKSKNEPFGGSENCTVGRVLPTVIGTVVVPVLPSGSGDGEAGVVDAAGLV